MYGVSLSRSVELTAQWDQILALGPMYPVILDDLSAGRNLGSVIFMMLFLMFIIVLVISFMRLLFILEVRLGWRNWIREDPSVHPYRWLRPDLVPPAPFLQCEPHLTPGGSGVLADPGWD